LHVFYIHSLLCLRGTADGTRCFTKKSSTHAQKLVPPECGSFYQLTHAHSAESPSVERQVSAKLKETGMKYELFREVNTTKCRICVSNKIHVSERTD
jgi:hypothetical protein